MSRRINPEWYEEWKDMPEFVQEDKEAIHSIVVKFQTEEDIKNFSRILGITVTKKTKGIYFPRKKKESKVYVDES